MGTNPIPDIIKGVGNAQGNKTPKDVTKPLPVPLDLNTVKPQPEALSGTLADIVFSLVPRDATPDEAKKVASVFRDIAGMASKSSPGARVTPQQVLELTTAGLAQQLGQNVKKWGSFGTGLELQLKKLKLTEVSDFVAPWGEIADGLERTKPKG